MLSTGEAWSGRAIMADAKIGIDDIVAAAGAGAMRAMESRRVADERISMDRLVASGFTIRFEIWAGGPWGPIGPGPLQGGYNKQLGQ
jgi:hypothetical protein